MNTPPDFGFRSYEEALIRACYHTLLERQPEPAAKAAETAPYIAEEEEQRFREILKRFTESDEFAARRAHVVGQPLLPVEALIKGSRLQVEDQIRALCRTTYLGNGTALCRILGRFHMFVHTSDVGFATHVLHRGIWEMPLTEFMVRKIRPGMRVLDVGGNFGYYSVLMSALVQSAGYCHVFEPNRNIARLLRRTLSVNGFDNYSHVWEIALADHDQEDVHFFIPDSEPKNARLVVEIDDRLRGEGSFTRVPIRAIDGMAEQLGRIDFIKIDTEGAEMAVLAGMRNTIRQQRPAIVVEVNCGRDYDAEPMLRELLDIYGSINFVGDDGFSHPTSIEYLLSTNVGSDWLVHFGDAVGIA